MTKLNKFLWTIAFLFLAISGAQASTTVAGVISSNQVWTAANSPYLISQNVLVNQGISVKVMPGVTVQFLGDYTIIVDGEFSADGTYDSVIVMDKAEFSFTKKSVDYNFITDQGSHFNYCFFTGKTTGGYRTIILDKTSLLVKNSKFVNCYYTIYCQNSNNDTVRIMLLRCIWDTNNGNVGYPANIYGQNTYFEMDGCLVLKTAGMFIPQHSRIVRNTILNCTTFGGIRIPSSSKYNPGEVTIKCNVFRNFKNSVLEVMGTDSFMKLNIEENTFDSSENFIEFTYWGTSTCKPVIRNNNFLYHKKYSILFKGGSLGVPDPFDLTSNYWGTTDTAKIDSAIFDFSDDITVSPKANRSGYLSGSVSSCSEPSVSIRAFEKTAFNLYPNPAISSFTINFRNQGTNTVRIYNIMGEMVYDGETNESEMTLDVSSLVNGLYIVEVICEGKQSGVKKLVITK